MTTYRFSNEIRLKGGIVRDIPVIFPDRVTTTTSTIARHIVLHETMGRAHINIERPEGQIAIVGPGVNLLRQSNAARETHSAVGIVHGRVHHTAPSTTAAVPTVVVVMTMKRSPTGERLEGIFPLQDLGGTRAFVAGGNDRPLFVRRVSTAI